MLTNKTCVQVRILRSYISHLVVIGCNLGPKICQTSNYGVSPSVSRFRSTQNGCHTPAIVISSEIRKRWGMSSRRIINSKWTYGVPSGPVINALITSTRVSSTRKKMELSQATGKFVVRTASCVIEICQERSQKEGRDIVATNLFGYG
jgi:hypothetical protein